MQRIRTRIVVTRPYSPGSGYWPEVWEILVTEVPKPWGKSHEVQGRLLGVVHPDPQWDLDRNCWIDPHAELLPGVVVPADGPHTIDNLGKARKVARELAGVLGGRMRYVPDVDEDS